MPLLHKSAGHERKKAEKTENVEVTKEAEKEAEKEVAPEKEAPKLKLSPIVALAKQAGVSLSGDETIASFLMPESDIPEEVQLRFLDVVETHSGQILSEIELAKSLIERQKLRKAQKAEERERALAAGIELKQEPEEDSLEEYLRDAEMYLGSAKSETIEFGVLFPPIGEGKKLTLDELNAIFKEKGIVYGLNNQEINAVVKGEQYFKLFVIARGSLSVDGVDGKIEDLYSRAKEVHFVSDADDIVDYKNLNLIQKVEIGGVVCRFVPPVPAKDGMTVKGDVIKGKEGRAPAVPGGQNTEFNSATNELVATADGHVSYIGGLFNVYNVYEIKEDVDNTTGNIDMNGDVLVKGSVLEGFEIKATGDVTVYGNLEGAYVTAGGSIHLRHGMNGNLKGRLNAGVDIEAKFLENCTVFAKGTVTAGSIVNCKVNADAVVAQGKPGAIIGGEINVYKDIKARIVGNESAQTTRLAVGTDISIIETIKTLKREITSLSRSIEETDKNVAYLEKSEVELSEEYKNLLKNLKYKTSAEKIRLAKNNSELKKIMEEQNNNRSTITVEKLFPIVKVEITGALFTITDNLYGCTIFKEDGEIKVTSN